MDLIEFLMQHNDEVTAVVVFLFLTGIGLSVGSGLQELAELYTDDGMDAEAKEGLYESRT